MVERQLSLFGAGGAGAAATRPRPQPRTRRGARGGRAAGRVVMGRYVWRVARALAAPPLGVDARWRVRTVRVGRERVDEFDAPWGRFVRVQRCGAVNWFEAR